ncbi:hypothetical protein [Mesorhizobium sp. M0244]|uniref:hypothetical protein n=1 Tax=Mesorhizobium sp. M0244 TaxID=2956926 RepID=UPI003338C934
MELDPMAAREFRHFGHLVRNAQLACGRSIPVHFARVVAERLELDIFMPPMESPAMPGCASSS